MQRFTRNSFQSSNKGVLFKILTIFLIVFTNQMLHAGPWFTGPLLAPAGHTVPRGHTNFEMYTLDIFTKGRFDPNGHIVRTPLFKTFVLDPVISHGFTDWMDIQASIPYVFDNTQGQNYNRLADVSTTMGLQFMQQKKSKWKPDLRFAIQETFPTGKYDHLNPAALGTDATGFGSYATQLALNFQHLAKIKSHYLRTRLSLTRLYSSPVKVRGFNVYGGAKNTQGEVNTGIENDADLAFEFTLTQHWVLVLEGYVSEGDSTQFNGINGLFNIGSIGGPENLVLSGPYFEEALAPAIEYNFNANVGLIGGVWFPVKGRNTADYMTYMLALNAYW